jgi:hypothetical protein
MFENSTRNLDQRKSPLARIAGLLLTLAIFLRIFSSLANTEEAFWACFLAWAVLSVVDDVSRRKAEKSQRPESEVKEADSNKSELSGWWKAFGPLAAFNFITILLGFWPLGGLGILIWLISWIAYDFYESSRFGKRGLITLSLR